MERSAKETQLEADMTEIEQLTAEIARRDEADTMRAKLADDREAAHLAEIKRLNAIPKCDPVYCTYGNGDGVRLQAEIERLRNEPPNDGLSRAASDIIRQLTADVERMTTEIGQLRELMRKLLPDIERLEACEASADDGYGERLRFLRSTLIEARRATEAT